MEERFQYHRGSTSNKPIDIESRQIAASHSFDVEIVIVTRGEEEIAHYVSRDSVNLIKLFVSLADSEVKHMYELLSRPA